MRKAVGPILTTGVALVAAAVVVANPVTPPVRDLQISTTQLTNPDALIPFDKNLLKSISQPSPASTFTAALAQILGALAAEADRIGTEVNSAPVTPPGPAASASQTPPVSAPSSADVPLAATPNGTPNASATVVGETVATTTTVAQVVSEITATTAYLGNQVVEAAYAAVNALVNTPDVIFKAVKAILVGDLATAFVTIVQGVRAFFNPGLVLVGGIDNIVGQFLPPPIFSPSTATVPINDGGLAARPATTAHETTSTTGPQTTTAESGGSNPQQTNNTGRPRHAANNVLSSISRQQLIPSSAASAPAAEIPSGSAESADSGSDNAGQPKSKAAGTDKPRSTSSSRSHNAGARGASAGK